MARLARAEVFDPSEIAIVHLMNRVVRRCFLFGDDPISGKNFDHRKVWIEDQLRLAGRLFWNRPARLCDYAQSFSPDLAIPARLCRIVG